MAAAPSRTSTFSLFPDLSPELRNQIWYDALPDKIGPALFFYRKGCWRPRRLLQSDEGYNPENDEHNLNFEFRHDLLDDTHFELPLIFVNREARSIALAWVREQGIEIRTREGRQRPVFVRPFDPKADALYITPEQWDNFLYEPEDRQFQPDLLEKLVDVKTDLTRIAMSEALLQKEATTLPEISQYFFQLEALYIVVDAQPDLHSVDNDMKVQRRWEFESTRERAFVWNDERGAFDGRESEYAGAEALYRLIGEASKELGAWLAQNHIRNFEILPVLAVRR